MLAGTPGFQAPEQLCGTHIGVECDVYAFGAVMVVLFSERPVWPNLSPYQIMFTVTLEKKPPTIDNLTPPYMAGICSKCFLDVSCRANIADILHALLSI